MEEENDFYKVMREVKSFLVDKKVGSIQVNCFRGGVSSINISETVNWKADEKRKEKP
jgi:hypothetical protein